MKKIWNKLMNKLNDSVTPSINKSVQEYNEKIGIEIPPPLKPFAPTDSNIYRQPLYEQTVTEPIKPTPEPVFLKAVAPITDPDSKENQSKKLNTFENNLEL